MGPTGSAKAIRLSIRIKPRRAASAGLALALIGGFFACGAPHAKAADRLVNHAAPEFAKRDLQGRMVSLARLRGKVVLLNFWATWCAPCEAEMPVFAVWQREYGARELQVIGVSMDDSQAPARRLAARLQLDYPILMGDAKLGERYGGVLGLPLTFLIDRKGVVRRRIQGAADLKAVQKQVQQLLAEP